MSERTGFIRNLFDLSFSEFITVRIIRFLYGLAILGSACGATGVMLYAWERGFFIDSKEPASFALSIFLSVPIAVFVFILSVIVSRVSLELTLVVFRIAENTDFLAEQKNVD